MKYPKLFDDQPRITKKLLKSLTDRGLIVPSKSWRALSGQVSLMRNQTAGQVIGYNLISSKFKAGLITQADARILLAIEAVRPGGPRETHVSRLMANVYVEDKVKILNKIQECSTK